MWIYENILIYGIIKYVIVYGIYFVLKEFFINREGKLVRK